MDFKKIVKVFLFFLIGYLVFSCLAHAIGIIQVDQAKIRLSILPGKAKSGVIKVSNPHSEPQVLKAYLEDWFYFRGADGSKEFSPSGTTKLSAADWITFDPAEFVIPAYGTQNVNYIVRVPPTARGGRYAVLFFESQLGQTEIGETKRGVSLAVRLAALFYIEPEGTISRTVQLDNFTVEKESKGGPLNIKMDFKNSGNVDITAGGTFAIIDRGGIVYARGEFNNVYTFPGDEAELVSAWAEPLPKGKYDLILTLDLGKAVEEMDMGRGPVITKEIDIEIGLDGQVIKLGELR